MCGRYALFASGKQLQAQYNVMESFDWESRYNIAPTQRVPVLRLNTQFRRKLVLAHWGIEISPGGNKKLLINARSETAHEKNTFKTMIRHGRCVLPASGFYEWENKGLEKNPWLFQIKNEDTVPMALAGLLRETHDDSGLRYETVILTTKANKLMAPFHDRMPVIVPPRLLQDWLNPYLSFPKHWALPAFPAQNMAARPVSKGLNSVANEGPELLISSAPRQPTLF